MNLLHIDSSVLGPHSISRKLSADVVAKMEATNQDIVVTYRDLAADPVTHLSGSYLMAAQSPETAPAPDVAADLAIGKSVLQEFLAADVVVIGVAFYNFTIASQLKAWIDRIVIVGQTFRYGEHGPEGLVRGKRLILAIARGGLYGPGTPAESFEHAESYLRAVFGFLGVTDIDVVLAEGVRQGPDQLEAAMNGAAKQIAELA